jgi:Dynein heavy chain, N-terminal region 2
MIRHAQVQIDVKAVAEEMTTLQQRADALAAKQPADPVAGELLAALSDFDQSLPLLRLLAAPQLRDRHWAGILATLGLEVYSATGPTCAFRQCHVNGCVCRTIQ